MWNYTSIYRWCRKFAEEEMNKIRKDEIKIFIIATKLKTCFLPDNRITVDGTYITCTGYRYIPLRDLLQRDHGTSTNQEEGRYFSIQSRSRLINRKYGNCFGTAISVYINSSKGASRDVSFNMPSAAVAKILKLNNIHWIIIK